MKRTERGWPGHYCAARDCMFRRNTLLELGELRVVVSTVGLYRNKYTNEIETIGLDRHYETMAFAARKDGAYWEANVHKQISFTSPWQIYMDVQNIPENQSTLANDMHENVVKEVTKAMKENTLKVQEEI
jgi:hypothetical protein